LTWPDIHHKLLAALEGDPIWDDDTTPKEAFEQLKILTQKDFGYNFRAWTKYFDSFKFYHDAFTGYKEWDKWREIQGMNKFTSQLLLVLDGNTVEQFDSEISTKEDAYEVLKIITKEDFGYDIRGWQIYFQDTNFEIKTNFEAMKKGYAEWRKIRRERIDQRKQNNNERTD